MALVVFFQGDQSYGVQRGESIRNLRHPKVGLEWEQCGLDERRVCVEPSVFVTGDEDSVKERLLPRVEVVKALVLERLGCHLLGYLIHLPSSEG